MRWARGNDDDGKLIPLEVKSSDRILFGKYSGTEIKLDGEEHLIMREDDILGSHREINKRFRRRQMGAKIVEI